MMTNKSLTFSSDDLKDKKLFVAAPMYGGMCHGTFCKSMNELFLVAGKHDIEVRVYYLFNESLITRARNYAVDEFLRSDSTHLMFIDSDVGFNHKDVWALMHLCDGKHDMGIIGGAYPKKTIAWEKVKIAVDKGFADDSPFNLEKYVGDYAFNLDEDQKTFKLNEPVKVKELGTGFMMIHRDVFEEHEENFPEKKYIPDHVRTKNFDGSSEIMAYFDVEIDPETRRYLSEDYSFCKKSRDIGIDIWLCPWMTLSHTGTYTFGGSLADIASIDASPTASDESKESHYTSRQQKRAEKRSKNKRGK